MKHEPRIPSFAVDVRTLPSGGVPAHLHATQRDLDQIALAAGVANVTRLDADLLVTRWRRDGVQVMGRLQAAVEQPCRITLEPVTQEISEEIRITLVPADSGLARQETGYDGELILDPEGDDPPDVFSGNVIDLWPIVIEQLILAIDPFPTRPGAKLETLEESAESSVEARESPFAELSRLKLTGKSRD
jgi:uncharacterized metal-binding protein YceD (DUF177 family)